MLRTEFQPNVPSSSTEKMILLVSQFLSYGDKLEFSAMLKFYHSEALQSGHTACDIKFENHGCSGFKEKAFEWTLMLGSTERTICSFPLELALLNIFCKLNKYMQKYSQMGT